MVTVVLRHTALSPCPILLTQLDVMLYAICACMHNKGTFQYEHIVHFLTFMSCQLLSRLALPLQ